uniref:G-patch domain-containing protein n=2 Tax=Timema TaxID=61471 RepID=A0A7R9NVX3_9NEOP|nr:unnamed protein product [Timema tahoe]
MDALGIKYMPERLWNYDETGLFYVVKPGRAITAVDKRYVYKRVYANRAECAKFYPTSDQLGLFQLNGGGDDQNNVVSPSLGNSIEAKKEISTKNDEEPNVQSNKFEESIAALDNNQHNCATETLESIAIKELLEAHDKANCVGMFIKCRTSQNCFPQTKLLHDALLYSVVQPPAGSQSASAGADDGFTVVLHRKNNSANSNAREDPRVQRSRVRKLLTEAQNTPSTSSGESLVVQMTKRKHQVDAEESSLEDYERVPVENFGMALLKGMGWKEGKGIGKKPRVVETITQVPRPRGVGLGAMITLPVQNEEDPEKPLRVSTQVSIISGSYKKCSGTIKGYQDFGRVMVYIASKNVTVSVNESAVVVLEKKNPRGKLDIKQSHGSTTNEIDRSRYFRQDCGYHFDKR